MAIAGGSASESDSGSCSDSGEAADADDDESDHEHDQEASIWLRKPPPGGVTDDGSAPGNYAKAPYAPSDGVIIPGGSFAGIGEGLLGTDTEPFKPTLMPSDPAGAAGLTQYVQMVTSATAVFHKATGTVLLARGPSPTNTLFKNLGGPCAVCNCGRAVGRPAFAKGWLVSHFAVDKAPRRPCTECRGVAVSATTGRCAGHVVYYSIPYGSSLFPDYRKIGAWTTAVDDSGCFYVVT